MLAFTVTEGQCTNRDLISFDLRSCFRNNKKTNQKWIMPRSKGSVFLDVVEVFEVLYLSSGDAASNQVKLYCQIKSWALVSVTWTFTRGFVNFFQHVSA